MPAAMDDRPPLQHRLVPIRMDLNELSACPANADALNAWVGSLPMANLAAATVHLLSLVAEIPRLHTDYLTRLELLETIRPTVYYMCARIDRQSAASGIRWTEALEDAQSLQRTLAHGFTAVVLAALPVIRDDRAARDAFLQALHRALTDLSHVQLRYARYYLQPESGYWLHLHQLFHVARGFEFAGQKIRDPEHHNPAATTIADAWLRTVLFSLARSNQLRSSELNQLFNALEQWSTQASIVHEPGSGAVQVNLFSDHPPRRVDEMHSGEQVLTISTDVLAYEIEAFLQEIPSTVPVPDYVSEKLLRHLVTVWSRPRAREHRRLRIVDDVEVGIGLRVASNCFAREIGEQRAMETPPENDAPALATLPPLATHQTRATDTSPLGFRLAWPEGLPPSAQIGEIVALRERSSDQWRVGVVRWIGGDRNGAAITGIELLAPTAIPISARVVRTRGGTTGFAKALLLPAIPSQNRPATMITPRLPFQPMQKIQIQRGRMQSNVHLGQCLGQTENYNQFAFRMLGSYLENRQGGPTMGARTKQPGAHRPTSGE
jgi:hypothetical protein